MSNKVIFFSKKVSDENILANTYNNIGVYYHDKGVLDSTFYYYVKAENIYKKLGDSLKVGEMEFFQARLLYEQGLRMESEVKVANSLRILQNFPLSAVPFEANQLMALCLIEREQYPKAKEYIEKAIGLMLEDFGKNKMLHSKFLIDAIAMGYNNLSAIEIGLGNYDQASINAEKGLKFLSEKRTKILLGLLNSNKARAGFYSNLEKHKLKSKSFISVIEETYDLAKKLGHNHLQYNSAMTIAEMYYEIENKQEALCWAQQAYLIASQNNLKVLKRDALEFIIFLENFQNKQQVAEALELNHLLVKEDNTTRNRFARIAYETEEVILENDQLKSTLLIISLTSSVILVFLFLIFYVIRLKMKNREIKLINMQQLANEQIYQLVLEKTEVINSTQNRIAKNLHDGVVNNIFSIRFNLQRMKTEEIELQNDLIKELQLLEKNTRNITHVLYQENLFKNNTLISLIEDLISFQKNEWNTSFDFEYEKDINRDKLTSLDKVNIYFIVREAIQNVNKHSKATKCSVIIKSEKGGFSIRVTDNGVGFNQNIKVNGIGISSMKERVSNLNSELIIISNINLGTDLYFKIEC